MDAIKVTKVEEVRRRADGRVRSGTLHLTAHHLIFGHDSTPDDEIWTPYPLISLVTREPQTLDGSSPLTIHCRNFRSFTLLFRRDTDASDVFDSIKGLTVASTVTQLYAFFYTPNPPFANTNGWSIYSPREEFARMGVGSRTKAWRFTDINKDYSFCSTYPARLVVPTRISDTTLQYASKYRSKCRIPTLAYLHWANYGTITRSSQPMVGLTNNRSIQDEKLIEAIFQSHYSPDSRVTSGQVYGATATNLIIDARPTTNAMANVAKGAGTENMDYYKDGKKAYLGVDNIHVMRDSLNKVVDALREADALAYSVGGEEPGTSLTSLSSALLDRHALRRSGWLRHLSAILDGTVLIVRNVHVNSSHVLIHCSDGWDRTAQLSSLSQLCLDPYYRTMKGFQVLVEKDWLSFGHRFLDRCGHLSSEKFFLSNLDTSGGGGAEAAQAFLASVQNKLGGQHHLKETSPVFHQFLECVRQIQRQFPERFQFNNRYLEQIFYHLYSCQFGTFLFNCERDRKVGDGGLPPVERTVSMWDFLNSEEEMDKNTNPSYDPTLDEPARRDGKADMGVLFPNPKNVRFWSELYGRTDEEMNGKVVSDAQGAEVLGPVESADDDPIPGSLSTPTSPPRSSTATPTPIFSSAELGAFTSPPSRTVTIQPSSSPLTSSMPELSTTPPPSRADNWLSASTGAPLRAQSPGMFTREDSLSPLRTRLQKMDFPGGMKSMWGKFSSNATAALSVVQDAYEGVAKDFKGLSVPEYDGPRASGSNLQSQSRSLTFSDDDWTSGSNATPSSGSSTFSSPAAPKRWQTEGPSRGSALSNLTLENPWGTSTHRTGRSSPKREKIDGIFNTSSVWDDGSGNLPTDPTVEFPSSNASRSRTGSNLDIRVRPAPISGPENPAGSTVQPKMQIANTLNLSVEKKRANEEDTDPLGVGPL